MTLVSEAIARYHKLIESEPYIDLAWAHALQERIKSEKLDGRPVSPVLRPHLITQKDYAALARASETLLSAISRVEDFDSSELTAEVGAAERKVSTAVRGVPRGHRPLRATIEHQDLAVPDTRQHRALTRRQFFESRSERAQRLFFLAARTVASEPNIDSI